MNLKNRSLFLRKGNQGYAALAMVTVIGITALGSLMYVFRRGLRSHETQVVHQVKVDYRQKEDALLRALVYIVPNKAIGAMMPNSAGNEGQYSWDQIFTEAITLSNAGGALNTNVINSFSIPGIINANTGNMNITTPDQIVSVIAGSGSLVGPGSASNMGLLNDSLVGSKLPPALTYGGSASADENYPIISTTKTYPASASGLGASATEYPLYNIIDYPNIRFGLSGQDGRFVAKRNWWAFSLTFGGGGTGANAMPVVKKNYVLSIYEVPEQMALSTAGTLQVGSMASGAAWQNTTISGSVFATDVDAKNLSLLGASSRVSARRSIELNGGGTVGGGGMSVANGFDDLQTRETRWASADSDFYGASVAGDSGRVAILPLSQGNQFIRTEGAVARTNTLSDTGWYEYAMGGLQCKMRIEVTAQQTNRPVGVRFTCQQGMGTVVKEYYAPGSGGTGDLWTNHDNDVPIDGVATRIPFYWENLGVSRDALVINLGKIHAYLNELGLNPNDRALNNSLSIAANTTDPSVSLPTVANGSEDDMGVVFRQSRDLTSFTNGLSVITDYRVFFAEDFNQVPNPALSTPSNAGLPSEDYYPPVSVFAASKRYGTTATPVDRIHVSGQLTSIATSGTVVNPLDLKTNATAVAGQTLAASRISADLSQIVSPAQLPPINRMTWLVMVEEIHSTSTTSVYDDGNNGGGNDPGGVDPSNPGQGGGIGSGGENGK